MLLHYTAVGELLLGQLPGSPDGIREDSDSAPMYTYNIAIQENVERQKLKFKLQSGGPT